MPELEVQKIVPQPINGQPSGLKTGKKPAKNRTIIWVISIVTAILIGFLVVGVIWYNTQLTSVGTDKGQLKLIKIASGSTPAQIGDELQNQSIIRSSIAFNLYIKMSNNNKNLQAGTYRLSPAETIPQIVNHLVNGSVDQFSITFYPGATLVDNTNATKKYDVTTVLKNAGYSDADITAALKMTYDSPLFANKPASADLEGYIYGETYNFNVGATVQDILTSVFQQYYSVVQKNNLIAGFASHGLNLYEGITLASIVQRESGNKTDQPQIAQVFYSRLASGMTLGSDVTYQYIADKIGVARDPNLNSPYNTRRFAGLPPGPIAVPGLTAMQAVANPASGDYLFFLSGDDNITYFAKTEAEHQANVINHCAVKCSTP
ncbi:MAG: endolytic transglycosylase MltG [Candidatus Saccharibacteria bacterium]